MKAIWLKMKAIDGNETNVIAHRNDVIENRNNLVENGSNLVENECNLIENGKQPMLVFCAVPGKCPPTGNYLIILSFLYFLSS